MSSTARELKADEQLIVAIALHATTREIRLDPRNLFIHQVGSGTFVVTLETELEKAHPSGPPAATVGFLDIDGIPVFVDVFLSRDGSFAEVDIWKANGDDIIEFPKDRDGIVPEKALYRGDVGSRNE